MLPACLCYAQRALVLCSRLEDCNLVVHRGIDVIWHLYKLVSSMMDTAVVTAEAHGRRQSSNQSHHVQVQDACFQVTLLIKNGIDLNVHGHSGHSADATLSIVNICT